MASPTKKVRRIRSNKKTALGQRRKREIRREIRRRIAEVARTLDLGPGALDAARADPGE